VIRGGSPCIVRVGGSKLCIRDDELRVMVRQGRRHDAVAAELAVGESGRVLRVTGVGEVSRRMLDGDTGRGDSLPGAARRPARIRTPRLPAQEKRAQQIEIDLKLPV
jgi:Fe2+ transport system protein FeoA